MEDTCEILFTRSSKVCLPLQRFSRNSQHLVALLGCLVYRIVYKSNEELREYGQRLIYTVKQSMAFIVPVFTKLVIAKRLQVGMFSTKFYANR
jgi:hypothetical protein